MCFVTCIRQSWRKTTHQSRKIETSFPRHLQRNTPSPVSVSRKGRSLDFRPFRYRVSKLSAVEVMDLHPEWAAVHRMSTSTSRPESYYRSKDQPWTRPKCQKTSGCRPKVSSWLKEAPFFSLGDSQLQCYRNWQCWRPGGIGAIRPHSWILPILLICLICPARTSERMQRSGGLVDDAGDRGYADHTRKMLAAKRRPPALA